MSVTPATRAEAASPTQIPEPPIAWLLFADTRLAWFWFLVRLYCGWAWLEAGWSKVQNPAWFGPDAGAALQGFINGALSKTGGDHPDVTGWYAAFLQTFVLPYATFWSNLVVVGELLVGLGLLAGALTGIAAFFGSFMNANYLLAGTVQQQPAAVHPGHLAGAGLAGGGLVGPRPLAAAGTRHAVVTRPAAPGGRHALIGRNPSAGRGSPSQAGVDRPSWPDAPWPRAVGGGPTGAGVLGSTMSRTAHGLRAAGIS